MAEEISFEQLVQEYRHGNGRKCGSFAEVDNDETMVLPFSEAHRLGVYGAEELGVVEPFSDLPKRLADQLVFVLLFNDKHYLVNTEGFAYCRYIMPCVIGEQ